MMSRERPSPLEQASVLAGRSFAGRTVLVSGGGSGIGEATACLAARLGAQVIICGRKLEKLTRVSEAIRALGLRCEPIALESARAASSSISTSAPARRAPWSCLRTSVTTTSP